MGFLPAHGKPCTKRSCKSLTLSAVTECLLYPPTGGCKGTGVLNESAVPGSGWGLRPCQEVCRGESERISRDHITAGFGSDWGLFLTGESLKAFMNVTVSALHVRNTLFRCPVGKGLEGHYSCNQRKDILELLNPGLKRTGSFCFLPLGTRLPCCEKLQPHGGEPRCTGWQSSCAPHGSQHQLLTMRHAILDSPAQLTAVPEDIMLSRKSAQLSPIHPQNHEQ